MTGYGPLPLTFTGTTMCLVLSSSNGTITGLAGGVSAGAARATANTRPSASSWRFMLQSLSRLDGNLMFFPVADHRQLHLLAHRPLGGQLLNVGSALHFLTLKLANAVARLQVGAGSRSPGEDGLDGNALVGAAQFNAQEAARHALRPGLLAEESPRHLHQAGHRIHPPRRSAAAEPLGQGRFEVE